MKNIPIVTLLIWTAFLLGFWLQPGVFRLDVVQLPAAIILSILLPVSFWQLKKRGKKYHAFIFIGILLFNVSFLLLSVQSNYSAQQALFKKINKGLRPEFAAYVETAASGNKRRLAAQIIYRRHGIALPYKNDAGSYMLYTPDKSDKEKHKENFLPSMILNSGA